MYFIRIIYRAILDSLPPIQAIKIQFFRSHRRLPNLTDPQTFNEHLQRRKLTWDDPLYVTVTDKIAVKEWVADQLGNEIITPTLWSGPTITQELLNVPFPFILKANHGSGMNKIIRLISDFDGIKEMVERWAKAGTPACYCEEWYNAIPRKLLAEALIGDGHVAPLDYKVFCFGGSARCIQVDTGRFTSHRRCFYDTEWTKLPFALRYPHETENVPPPKHLSQILQAAETIAQHFEFVRIDFYDTDSGPKFGEITLCPESGFAKFTPSSWDMTLGQYWPSS